MPDLTHADISRQIGRLEGRFDALEEKVDNQGQKLDKLLERDGFHTGHQAAVDRQEQLDSASANRRVALGAAIGGSGVTLIVGAILRKFGWVP